MKKIAVIGLGAIGSQVIWQLSKKSEVEVHGFDLHTPGHGFGASGGDGRVFRTVQYEDKGYVPLLKRSEKLWQELAEDTKQQLRIITGGLILGDKDSKQITTSLAGVEEYQLDAEVLDATELRKRYPFQVYHDSDLGILDHQAGIIRPELTIQSSIYFAESQGAVIHRNSRVTGIDSKGAQVEVSFGNDSIVFDQIVVATGAWISQLSPELSKIVQPRKVTSAWFLPKEKGGIEAIPGFVRTSPTHYYGVPSLDKLSIKLGLSGINHIDVETPDSSDYTVRGENFKPFEAMLEQYFPGLFPEPFRVATYFEGYTSDARPIIQRLSANSPISILAGFSGHGFKFAPVYGQIGANLALEESSDPDIDFLIRDFD